jgi:hypothetical protein
VTRRALELYAYVAPLLLAPLTLCLWWRTYDGAWDLALIAWLLPIVYAYVVPAVGTHVLRVWEFDTRLRVGRFRPHHGFVFGSATSALAWLCHAGPAGNALDIARASLVMGSVLGFWNLLYDAAALEAGVLRVYNQPWADGRGSAAIAFDYAPWFFGAFGAVYGAGIGIAEVLAVSGALTPLAAVGLGAALLVAAIAVPVAGYRRQSFRRHGHSGCSPVARVEEPDAMAHGARGAAMRVAP